MANYNPPRIRNLFRPGETFNFSRSKVDDFLSCPRCFYLDRVHGLGHPPGLPFTLNSAVDALLKREFDSFRLKQEPHPLIIKNGYDFVPFQHESLNEWRENFKGARVDYGGYSFSGAVDDLWMNKSGELIVVDYKATAGKEPVRSLDRDYHDGYKRQMEFYQWIFRKNGFNVSNTGFFVFCTGDNTLDSFNSILNFHMELIPYIGNDSWVEETLDELIECVESDVIPDSGPDCDMCKYVNVRIAKI